MRPPHVLDLAGCDSDSLPWFEVALNGPAVLHFLPRRRCVAFVRPEVPPPEVKLALVFMELEARKIRFSIGEIVDTRLPHDGFRNQTDPDSVLEVMVAVMVKFIDASQGVLEGKTCLRSGRIQQTRDGRSGK